MKRTAKVISAFFALAVLLWVIVMFFSVSESRWQCQGTMLTVNGDSEPATAFMKLDDYRWWVGFWSDSDAMAWVEVLGVGSDVYTDTRWNGHKLSIFHPTNIGGIFSTLSNELTIKMAGGVFEGLCKPLN